MTGAADVGVGAPPEPPARVVAALRAARLPGEPLCAYVYDLAAVRAAARAVRAELPPSAELFYAVKANGNPRVLRALAPLVAGFEVASAGEARAVVDAVAGGLAGTMVDAVAGTVAGTVAPTPAGPVPRLVASGPAKTDADLAALLRLGVEQVNVESPHELRRLARIAAGMGVVAPVALRVNRAGVDLAGSHRMAGGPSQFGMDADALAEAAAFAAGRPAVRPLGFHLHAVSNNTDAVAHAAFVADCVAWSVRAARVFGLPLSVVDVGGGVGVAYGGGPGFDLAAFGAALRGLSVPAGVRVAFELGRCLVAAAGWYAAEVVDVKRSHGRAVAVVRGGMHHFRLPSAWRMDHPFTVLPVEEWPYPWPRPQVAGEPVDVAGELCTPRDVFTRGAPVDRLRAGDVVVFALAGAYGWEISHHDFLRHPHPRHLVV